LSARQTFISRITFFKVFVEPSIYEGIDCTIGISDINGEELYVIEPVRQLKVKCELTLCNRNARKKFISSITESEADPGSGESGARKWGRGGALLSQGHLSVPA
jgi:hypothetical protein